MQSFDIEHYRLFGDLKTALAKDLAKLSVEANGGRSILFVYPPHDEDRYIAEAKKLFPEAEFIDLRRLFVEYVDSCGLEAFKDSYMDFGNEVYISNNFDDTFHTLIMQKIADAYTDGHIPFLIHTGIIYPMGFSNIHIMEHEVVLKSHIPLVVFYPATIDNDKIMFLERQVASRYRCLVVK